MAGTLLKAGGILAFSLRSLYKTLVFYIKRNDKKQSHNVERPKYLTFALFERERSLIGLLSQTACASILKTFQALLDRQDVRPGRLFRQGLSERR
jgi:hypothetical protein